MLCIAPRELVVIAIVAVLVFGPDRLPEFARTAGRLLCQVRQMVSNAQNDLRNELGPEFADLELQDLNPKNFVRKHLLEGADDFDEKPTADFADSAPERLPAGQKPPFDTLGLVEVGLLRYEVRMIGQVWTFGQREIRVPVGSTVTFVATSRDVVHGLFIPKANINVMDDAAWSVRNNTTCDVMAGQSIFTGRIDLDSTLSFFVDPETASCKGGRYNIPELTDLARKARGASEFIARK